MTRRRPPLVLVVDDAKDTRVIYAESLRFRGYRVEEASDGREAVERVGIEPTSEAPQPQASTSISGLSCCSLALRLSNRQEDRGASLIYLGLPLRRSSGPATRI